MRRLLGACLQSELTEDRIQDYIRTRLQEGVGGRTINMEVGELSRAMRLKWSVAWPSVRKLEENHDVGRALSPEEERALLTAAAADKSSSRNPMFYAFLQIALTTGMRSGEIAAMKWGQVDFETEVITVGKAKTARGTGRQIPMNPQLKAVLDMHAVWYSDPKRLGEILPEWYVFPGRKAGKAGEVRPLTPAVRMKERKVFVGTHSGRRGRVLPASRYAPYGRHEDGGGGRSGVHHVGHHGTYEPGYAGALQSHSDGCKARSGEVPELT